MVCARTSGLCLVRYTSIIPPLLVFSSGRIADGRSGFDRNECNDGKDVLHTRICSAKSLFTFVTSFMQEGP